MPTYFRYFIRLLVLLTLNYRVGITCRFYDANYTQRIANLVSIQCYRGNMIINDTGSHNEWQVEGSTNTG